MNGLHIVSFGTSLSARGGWQADLAAQLRERLNSEIEISIIAQPGANSDWGIDNVARVAALQAQVVPIEFAINDASIVRGLSLASSRDNLAAIAAALRAVAPHPRLVLMTMNPAHGLRGAARPLLDRY